MGLLAAKKLGLTQVPVHVADNLTPAQVKAYRLMDNRSHEEAQWDIELLGCTRRIALWSRCGWEPAPPAHLASPSSTDASLVSRGETNCLHRKLRRWTGADLHDRR